MRASKLADTLTAVEDKLADQEILEHGCERELRAFKTK